MRIRTLIASITLLMICMVCNTTAQSNPAETDDLSELKNKTKVYIRGSKKFREAIRNAIKSDGTLTTVEDLNDADFILEYSPLLQKSQGSVTIWKGRLTALTIDNDEKRILWTREGAQLSPETAVTITLTRRFLKALSDIR